MPLNPNISLAYKGIELQNPLDQYGKVMALQSAQQQNALAQRQMQEYDRSLQESEGIRNRLAGGAKIDDPETYNFLLGSKTGREILKQELELQKVRTEEAARRTKLMVDAETMWRNIVDQVRTKEDAVLFLDKMRNDPAMKGSPLTTLPFEGIVAQLPSDSAGLNEWAKRFAIGATKWVTENKPTTMQVNRGGQTDLIQVPGMGGAPTTVGAYADVPEPENVHAQNVAKDRASAPQVYVNTPVAKSLAAPVGARAEASLAKAEGATGMMESANMVREALNTGNVIAGPLAGARTKFAQVLEMAGAGDKDKLVATRNAIQGLATLTLESRAELKGQGQVTENEQKLLERARSGSIEEMTIPELQQVVNTSQRLAKRLWTNHQTLVKTMESDPSATDSIRYYRPTSDLPQPVGESKPKPDAIKRKTGLDQIFGTSSTR